MGAVRIYVKVNSDFDCTGYIQPRSITWEDGRTFRIDEVRDLWTDERKDRYTVRIRGEDRYLYFERPTPLRPNRCGRWFVLNEERVRENSGKQNK